jgi:hypothetical protein
MYLFLDEVTFFCLSACARSRVSQYKKRTTRLQSIPPLFFFFSSIPNLSGQRLEGLSPMINLGRSSPVVAAGGLVLVPVAVVDDAVVLL